MEECQFCGRVLSKGLSEKILGFPMKNEFSCRDQRSSRTAIQRESSIWPPVSLRPATTLSASRKNLLSDDSLKAAPVSMVAAGKEVPILLLASTTFPPIRLGIIMKVGTGLVNAYHAPIVLLSSIQKELAEVSIMDKRRLLHPRRGHQYIARARGLETCSVFRYHLALKKHIRD
ncbi:hypothetical protein PM082_001009 [Marasmius tenuissimus]|nr:hypothetical protein PM082_001009 [Marasmius tenuissimus]